MPKKRDPRFVLSEGFDAKAKDLREPEDLLSKAAEHFAKDGDKSSDQIDNLLQNVDEKDVVKLFFQAEKLVQPKKKTQDVVFLIDGSASMFCGEKAPVKPLVTVASAFSELSKDTKGMDAYTYMWGNEKPVKVDLTKRIQRNRVLNCAIKELGRGTNLAPTIQFIEKRLKQTKTDHPVHLVLMSDGDLVDHSQTKQAVEKLLGDRPNVSLTAIVVNRNDYTTHMEQAFEEFSKSFVGKQVACVRTFTVAETARALNVCLQHRIKQAPRRKADKTPTP